MRTELKSNYALEHLIEGVTLDSTCNVQNFIEKLQEYLSLCPTEHKNSLEISFIEDNEGDFYYDISYKRELTDVEKKEQAKLQESITQKDKKERLRQYLKLKEEFEGV